MSEQENGSREETRDLMASGLGGSGLSTEIKEPLFTHSAYNSWSYLYFGFDFGELKNRVGTWDSMRTWNWDSDFSIQGFRFT